MIFLWRRLPEESKAMSESPRQMFGLTLKPLSPCTLVEVPVGCLLACWGRHLCYNAVISLPSHQYPVCWVNLLPSPTKLTLSHPMFPVRDPELHSDASLCPTQWPRMTSTFHLTLGNLLTKDFCFSFPLFFGFVDFFPLFLSLFSNSPSFSFCVFFIFTFLPCQVAVSSTSICIRCCSTCPHP